MIKSIYIIFIFTVFIVKSAYNQQANFNEIDLKTNIGIDSIRINLLKFIFEFEQETQWSDFETKIDFKTKKRIILKLGREDFYNSQLNGEDKFEYANHFHFLDIDKDNDLDIIYNASDGADSDLILIWLNNNDVYTQIYQESGLIKSLKFKGETLELIIDSYQYSDVLYAKFISLYLSNGKANAFKTFKYFSEIRFPLDLKKHENIKQENLILRSTPFIKNEPCIEYSDGNTYCGNIIKQFDNERNGYSISTYKDIAGTTWWFSIIETEENKYELGWFKND